MLMPCVDVANSTDSFSRPVRGLVEENNSHMRVCSCMGIASSMSCIIDCRVRGAGMVVG